MRIKSSAVRSLAAALIWGGLLALSAHAAGRKSNGALVITDDLVGGSAGTVGAVGGAFTLDGSLSQVATSSSVMTIAPFTVDEAGYFSMLTTTPVTSSFLPVSSKTITVQWVVSNPTGTLYLIDASTASDFTGTVFSTGVYNSSYTTVAGLSPRTTYYLRYKANYMEGDETAFHPLGSTRTESNVPAGCDFGFNVKLDGSADFTTISAAVNALPTSFAGNACVVIRDTQTYSEQVVVQGFTNNGFSLKVMSDPSFVSSAPVVSPPTASTAGFLIKNASVTLQGITVRPTVLVPYGVSASSAYVTISSVNVDAGAFVSVAGIAINSWSAVSYSSITVQGTHGFLLTGTGNSISNSTAGVNNANGYALYLNGSAGNTIALSVFTNAISTAVYLSPGSNANTISRSTMTGGSQPSTFNGASGLVFDGASTNTVIDSVLNGGAGGSLLNQSPGGHGLYISGGSSNTVTRSIMSGGGGAVGANGSNNGGGAGGVAGGGLSWGGIGLYLNATASNTISQSYMFGGGGGNGAGLPHRGHGLFIAASSFNAVSQSVMSGGGGGGGAPGAGGGGGGTNSSGGAGGSGSAGCCDGAPGSHGLYISTGSLANTVNLSFMYGGGGGAAGSTNNPGIGGFGLYITASSGNIVTGSFMTAGGGGGGGGTGGTGGDKGGGGAGGIGAVRPGGNGGMGAILASSATFNLISLSTMTGGGAGSGVSFGVAGPGLYLSQSSTNTISQSYMANLLGNGAQFGGGADYNAISLSTMIGNTYGFYAFGADSNTVTQSYMWGGQRGAWLDTGADRNAISLSTMIGNADIGFYAAAADSNTVTQSYIWGTNFGARLDGGADYNAVSLSTMISNAYGLYAFSSASNTVTQSYLWGGSRGVFLDAGANRNAISLSTMIGNTDIGFYAFGAASNTVTQSYMWGSQRGTLLDTGSDRNSISLSTMIGNTQHGFFTLGADWNTVTQSYMWGSLNGVNLNTGSDYNAISLSTMTGNTQNGFYSIGSASNTVTRSYMWGGLRGAWLDANSNYNTISLSTMISSNASSPALVVLNSSGTLIQSSYIQGSTAAVVSGSTGTIINSSVFVATNTFGAALAMQAGGNGLTVASTTLRGGPSGRGLLLDVNNRGTVSIGSVTVTGTARGLEISTQAAGFVLAIDSVTFRGLTAGATAIHFLGGTFVSTFTLANFEDTSVGANVSGAALDPTSRISMFAHYGTRTGPPYENDPNSLVFWEAGPQPGCVVTRNVGAGQPYNSIQAGINALPTTLTGHSCVVIRDSAIYSESISVQNFSNLGSSITIQSDPALPAHPAVRLGFNIYNASVNIVGIDMIPTVILNTGIYVSSPNVTISSVNVIDPSGFFTGAGIVLSSWTTVSYTSVTVGNAHGMWLPGSVMATVAYSTAVNNSPTKRALFIDGASSSTITRSYIRNPVSCGAQLQNNASYNTISQSTITSSDVSGCAALALNNAFFNTITQSYIANPVGHGVALFLNANSNTISQSTMTSAAGGFRAIQLIGASSNTITQSYMTNPGGEAAYMINNSSYNTISLSTMTSNAAGVGALYLQGVFSNTVTQSYIANPAGYGAFLNTNANSNTIIQSTMTSSAAGAYALLLVSASSNAITRSYITNPAGYGAFLVTNSNYNTISQSTMTTNSALYDSLELNGAFSNMITQSYITNLAGYGAYLVGSNDNTISQSTMTSSAAGAYALWLNSASSNTVTQSYITNPAGDGVFLQASNWNAFMQSTARGGGSGIKAQSLSGLSIVLSTVTGGSGAASAGVWVSSQTEYLTLANSYVSGSTAVYVHASSRTVINASMLVGTGVEGSGLWFTSASLTLAMSSNTVLGGGLAGIAIDSNSGGLIRLSTNTVIARSALYGISVVGLSPATVWITSNTILPSLNGSATTYGVYLESLGGGATVQNNGIFYRTAGAAFGGVGAGAYGLYAKSFVGVKIDHNRISNPSMVTSGNFIGAALDSLTNAIFKFNDLHSTGGTLTTFNLLRIDGSPNTIVRNNILSSSMTATNNSLIVVDAVSQLGFSSDYNTFFSSNASYSGTWAGGAVSLLANWIATTGRDANTQTGNPLWSNPSGEDFHPLSRGGRWNGVGFVVDAVSGSGLDRADPAEPIGNEANPNGARANQGSYGQTNEASQTLLPCPITKYVRQAGGGDAVTINGGLAILPNPIVGGHSCVIIGDSGVYNEQVTVQGFINNGSSITIMLDPSLTAHPTVRSGFIIRNASVNIVGIDVAPTGVIAYGILASSANIRISSVNVYGAGFITTAGIAISSWSAISYSSVTTPIAHGLLISGGIFNTVSFSTAVNNAGAAAYALYMTNAASNTVTNSYFSNPAGYAVYVDNNSRYNTIDRSTITSQSGACQRALTLDNAPWNTVSRSVIMDLGATGAALQLLPGADNNTISSSIISNTSLGCGALNLNGTSSNTVTGSFISGSAALNWFGNYNTLSLSTVTANNSGGYAFNAGGSSNTIVDSYISNPPGKALWLNGSVGAMVNRSTITTNNGAFAALLLETGASSNTITRSYIANPAGYGAFFNVGANYNNLSQSTVTSSAAGYAALYLLQSSSNAISASYVQGSTAVFVAGSTGTVINGSVLVAQSAAGSGVALYAGSVNLVLSSNTIIPGAQGAGVYLAAGNAGSIILSTNTILGGQYGLFAAGQQAGTALWITSNTIVPAPVVTYDTFGIYLNGLTSGATIQNNGVFYRSPGFTGGNKTAALNLINSSGLQIIANRFSNPGMVTGSAFGANLQNTSNTVFKFNDMHSTGTSLTNAYHLFLVNSPGTRVRDNVFSSSWSVTGSSAALFVDAASQAGFVSDYNDFFSSNSFNSIAWGLLGLDFPWAATIGRDGNSGADHPRWKDPSAGVEDFHPLSQAGRWNGAAFVLDGFTSALLDAADPAEPFANEAAPNGGIANLGSYGNTAEASLTPAPPASSALAGVFTSSIAVSYGLVAANGYATVASTAANFTGTIFSSFTANAALLVLAPQGLAVNTTYFLMAGAVWGDFVSFNGVVLASATLANPPGLFTPTFTASNITDLSLVWTSNGNPLGTTYYVVLTTGAAFPNAFSGNHAFSAGPSFSATRFGLAQNTTYFAFITALNWNAMPSAYLAAGSTPTLAAAPLTAVSTFGAVGFSSFSVSWSANGNPLAVTTYTVTVSTASDFNAFATSVTFSTAPAFGPSATFTGLGANTRYYFRVQALHQNGSPTAYAVLGSTLTGPVTLQPPVIAGLPAVNISSIAATWGLSAGATGYNLVASLSNNPLAVFASSAPVGINATTATVFAPPLSPNTTYFLFVQAYGPGAVTAFSAYPATSTMADLPLTAVTTFTAVNLTSMTVSWLPGGNPVGVTTYTVVLSTGASYPNAFAGNRMISTMPAGAGPAASVTGLNDNTAYFLYVAGVNHNGVTGGFAALGSTVTLIAAPTAVVFDEISSNTIVASAYAPTPLFSNLGVGLSGTQIARNLVYQVVHGEQWAPATAMPAALRAAGAAGFSGKVYVFGGFTGAAAQNTAAVYDPASTLWTALPVLPTPRGAHAAAAAGGRIYAVGGTFDGFTSLNVNEEFDPVNNSWSTKAALAVRSDQLSAVGGGALYAFGGVTDGIDNMKNAQYDPTANAWTVRPDFPAIRHQAAAAAAAGPTAGLIIAAGGSGPANGNFAYDTSANSWSVKTALPAAVDKAAAASLGGKIYVVGGAGVPAAKTVYEYDPAADLWAARTNMITGREGLGAVAAGGRIYALGGSADGGVTSLGVNEEYDPGVATKFAGLAPNTQAGFKARARNQTGTLSAETVVVSTWTWAALPATAASTFTVVKVDSVTFSWALNGNPPTTEFKTRASTAASFGGGATVVSSDWGAMQSTGALALIANTTYFFAVKARNGVAGVPGIETAFVALGSTATMAAGPAQAPVTFSNAATNGLSVSWLPNGNPVSVTSYTVVLSTDVVYPNAHFGTVVFASTMPVGVLPTASSPLTLVANTTYFAFVSAINRNGVRTNYVLLGSTSTMALPPAVAAPTYGSVYKSSVTLAWSRNGNPVDVTTYSIVMSTGAAFNSNAGNVVFSTTPAGNLPSATASTLIPNTTYFGYAAAQNWNGDLSAYTALGSTATMAAAPATVVSTFSAVSITSFRVSWSANGNALSITTYTVMISTASDFNAFATSVTFSTRPAAGPSATFTGLTGYTQYFFQVQALNHGGNLTNFVALGSTTTLVAPLAVPALAGFPAVDITSITATWGLVPGATGYTLVASLLPANPPVVAASSTTFGVATTTATALLPPLTPNTSYFLFVQANGPLTSSAFAAYGATSTLAAAPATAASTFSAVTITSFTVSWNANGNPLSITTYTVQLSTASDFNAFATSVTFTTTPVSGPTAILTGLAGNTSYYLRIRALNHNAVASAFVNLGSTLTLPSPLFPFIINSQTGDAVWRRNVGSLYQVAFQDITGTHLQRFQVKASTTVGGLGSDVAPLTDVVIGLDPLDSYATPWALPVSVFNSLIEGVTNYISVQVFNGPPLNNFTFLQDAFYVQKDTTSPVIVDTQNGDAVARSAPGTTYTVGVRDPSSGLAAFQYSASLAAGTGNQAVIGWTDIAVVANTTSYNTPWPVNFAALISGVTNYISVRSWDIAGATTTAVDAFYVLKDTTGPTVAIAVPLNASFNSSLGVLSGTAASIFGVKGTEVSVLDTVTVLYWNPAGPAFNSIVPIMIPATGTTAWTLAPGIPWINGRAYQAVARSSTTSNIYSTIYATAAFVMDLSTPTVGVLAPTPNSTVAVLPQISGTALDPAPNPSGLSSVEVRLRRNTDGFWWNWFTQVWGPAAISSVTAGTAAWSLSPTQQLRSSLANGTSYFIAVRASDNALPANQGDFFVSGATFTWQDVTPPSAVVDLAASQGAAPGLINLSWTAPGDDAGVGLIALGEYRIFYSTNIAAVASTSAAQVVIATAGVSPGALQAYTLSGLSPSVTYYVRLALADSDFNWSNFSNQATTTAAPSPLNAITGHVLDISTIGITAVMVECWNAASALMGTTFTLADGSGTYTVNGLPAGNYKLRVTWTVNGFSSSLWQDGIAMGSTNVDFYLNINYALATLTGTLSTLSASSFGGGGLSAAAAMGSFVELHQNGREVARATPDPSGRWIIGGLLPGTYSVRAYTSLGYTAFQDVVLLDGEVRVLGFVFNPLPEESVFAFPNPARTATTIRFESALFPLEAGISIFDLSGNLVKEIPDSDISRAAVPVYRANWDLRNSGGQGVAPGVYHVMVKIRGGTDNQRAKVIKKLAVVR